MVLAAASVLPLMFVVAAAGYSTMHDLAIEALLPAVDAIALTILVARAAQWRRLPASVFAGLWIGAIATIGLEVVRIVGFRVFHAMPDFLPMLMGVLLANRFMEGPNVFSDIGGWADHFWSGASFAMIYLLVLGRERWWIGVIYSLLIAVVFMASPVVVVTGAGHFGSDVGSDFPAIVLPAHVAYGGLLGWLGGRAPVEPTTVFGHFLDASRRVVQ